MRQKGIASLLILSLFVFLAVGAGVFLLSNSQKSTSTPEPVGGNSSEAKDTKDAIKGPGTYVPYSESVLSSSSSKRRVLFFYANWCPTCRPADADFEANKGRLPEDVVLIRVNYNDTETDATEKALAQKYGVTYQHTYVQIDENGNEVAKWNGGATTEFLANIK